MSILFDENTSNYLQITDNASLSLPDGDWCFSFWENTTDNSGSAEQCLFSGGTIDTANSFNIYFGEASSATPNKLIVNIRGASNDSFFVPTSGTLTFDGTSRLWVIQRRSDVYEIWHFELGLPDPIQHVSYAPSPPVLEAVDPPELEIGRMADATNPYGGSIAHVWKGNFSLSESQIRSLGAGSSIYGLNKNPSYYLPLQSSVANPPDLAKALTVTRNGTLSEGTFFSVLSQEFNVLSVIASEPLSGEIAGTSTISGDVKESSSLSGQILGISSFATANLGQPGTNDSAWKVTKVYATPLIETPSFAYVSQNYTDVRLDTESTAYVSNNYVDVRLDTESVAYVSSNYVEVLVDALCFRTFTRVMRDLGGPSPEECVPFSDYYKGGPYVAANVDDPRTIPEETSPPGCLSYSDFIGAHEP